MVASTWVVVADGSRGRIFARQDGAEGFESPLDADFIGSRQPTRERVTDRAGQTMERHGPGSHAKSKSQDAKAHDQEVLAKRISEAVRTGRTENRFDRLVLVAPPAFLGRLRDCLDTPSARLVVAEHAKDLSQLAAHELEKRLSSLVPA